MQDLLTTAATLAELACFAAVTIAPLVHAWSRTRRPHPLCVQTTPDATDELPAGEFGSDSSTAAEAAIVEQAAAAIRAYWTRDIEIDPWDEPVAPAEPLPVPPPAPPHLYLLPPAPARKRGRPKKAAAPAPARKRGRPRKTA